MRGRFRCNESRRKADLLGAPPANIRRERALVVVTSVTASGERLGASLSVLSVVEKSAVWAGCLERGGVKFRAATVDWSPPGRPAWTGSCGHGWQRPRSGTTEVKSVLELPVVGRWISRWISLWITMWITRRAYCHLVR